MSRSRQACWWLAFCVAGQLSFFPLLAEGLAPAPIKLFSATNHPPHFAHSPVDFFRQLLAMTPDERENFLTNRPPEIRERILAKVGEYEALDPDERELRLRATELRWYLMPLLHESPTNRAARLEQTPDDIRPLVQSRLEEWIILPPQLQQEFLENEHTLRYFAHVDLSNGPPGDVWRREPNDTDRAHWDTLSEAERRQITTGFNQFFELTPDEKKETLSTLSDAERRQMEKTLQAFDKMPAAQRVECINAFAKFASMSASEQAEFLKNAARWSQMSPAERQAWCDLVTHVPEWPPMPVGFVMPMPSTSNSAAVTNHN
ncbi:MAG TPA: DUF3106 domain-containing protein [Verrucomicrobiae bacterium]|jgi:hypothetical protein